MAVLIVVLLVLYLVVKAGNSVSNRVEAENYADALLQGQQRWKNYVEYSDAEERRLYEVTYSPSKYWEMEKSALEVIHSLPGLEYASFKDHGIARRDYYSCAIVRLIEAVKHGKVPQSITHTIEPLEKALDMYVSRDAYIEFGKWLERTIRENGVSDAELYAQALGGYKALVWGPYQRLYGPYMNGSTKVQNIRVTDPLWYEKTTAFSAELCEELNAPIIKREKERIRIHKEWKAEDERREAERREAGNDISH